MAALPYMQLYVADYLADTAHLSALEHGAYLLLMFNYWQRGEPFKAKDEQTLNKRLASVARMSNDEWESVREALAEFFVVTEAEWSHPRIDRDLEAVNAKSEKAKAAGKASAARRFNGRSANVTRTLNHTEADTDTEQKKNNKPATRSASLSAADLKTEGVDEQVAKEFLAIRKQKRSPLTPLALEGIRREAGRAGMTLDAALRKCVERGWQGFEAKWVESDRAKGATQHGNFAKQDYRAGVAADGSF